MSRRFVGLVLFAAMGAASFSASASGVGRVGVTDAARTRAACPSAATAVIAGKHVCLRVGKACSKRYEKTYRKHRLTCRHGRLRKAVPPSDDSGDDEFPPPTAAPPVPGHYAGLTSQGHPLEFDVIATDSAWHIHFAQVDETCTPGPLGQFGSVVRRWEVSDLGRHHYDHGRRPGVDSGQFGEVLVDLLWQDRRCERHGRILAHNFNSAKRGQTTPARPVPLAGLRPIAADARARRAASSGLSALGGG